MAQPTLKYATDIAKYAPTECPPKEHFIEDKKAYRFVNSPMVADDFKNYIGLGKLPRETHSPHQKCKHCGLSMYADLKLAVLTYNNNPNKDAATYTHIAEGIIKNTDGLWTKPVPKSSHFTLFEFEGVDLINQFKILDPPL